MIIGIRASPEWIDTTSQTACGCPDASVHTKGKMADCTCMVKPAITLLYSHIYTPAIKLSREMSQKNVRPMAFCEIGSIMEIPVEPVFLALFYNHTLVAQECSHLHSLVVSQFYALPSVALFQPFEKVVIAVDITTFKSSV